MSTRSRANPGGMDVLKVLGPDTLPFRTKATFDLYVTAETSARQELMLADAAVRHDDVIGTQVAQLAQDGAEAAGRVQWEIARDADFSDTVASGSVSTTADADHTVKVDATGLAADTEYYYRFLAGGAVSPTGRTHTAPAADVK